MLLLLSARIKDGFDIDLTKEDGFIFSITLTKIFFFCYYIHSENSNINVDIDLFLREEIWTLPRRIRKKCCR